MNVWIDPVTLATTARPRGYKPKNTSKPPRTREGKTYPGGRHMRRAMADLSRRTSAYEASKSSLKGKGADCYTRPGSMK